MDQASNTFEVDAGNFDRLVIENSRRVPVLVDFWADWCAPCKMLMPVLQKLAGEYGERLVLAKVDTEAQQELAARNGIRSLPTLHLYRHGEKVDETMGVQPESALRALIDPWIERESDRHLDTALALAAGGQRAQALALLDDAAAAYPGNTRLRLAQVRLCLQSGDLTRGEVLYQALPAELRGSDEGRALAGLLEFARTAVAAPERAALVGRLEENPADAEARYRLAAREVLEERHDEALETLMELLRRDPRYGEGAARRSLLGLFALLGDADERVGRYRRQMFALLH